MKWISIDPGETTGYAVWNDETLIDAGQRPLWEFIDVLAATSGVVTLPTVHLDPDLVAALEGWERLVVENWRIYPEQARNGDLDFDECRTARGIGTFELLTRASGKEIILQPALIKDESERGGAEQLFISPRYENRHANDAIRHGWFYVARQRPNVTPTVEPRTEGSLVA